MIITEVIKNNLPKTCGIYCFTNKLNGKQYIGQTINLLIRFKKHLEKFKHGDIKILYNAFLSMVLKILNMKYLNKLIILIYWMILK